MYASLRVGPWSIERRDRLDRLRDIARRETSESERRIEFALRQWERKRPGVPPPDDTDDLLAVLGEVDTAALEALDAPDSTDPTDVPPVPFDEHGAEVEAQDRQ